MTDWTAIGAVATAASVFIGLLARYIQEDLKRTRLRYYLRPATAPEDDQNAAILTVVNVGRSTAKDVLCYLSPGNDDCSEPPSEVRGRIETDETACGKSEGHALIVKVPVLHPCDRFKVLLVWKGGVKKYTRKHRDRFRISYEYGTSNKLLRMFGRVHMFWWWQRCKEDKRDARHPSSLEAETNIRAAEVSVSVDVQSP